MAIQHFNVEGIGDVAVYKRRGARSMRLSVTPDGIRLTLPPYVPYRAGLAFIESKRTWLKAHQGTGPVLLVNAQPIGKTYTLRFNASFTADQPQTRLIGQEVVVQYPSQLSPETPLVQAAAKAACIRAIRREAEDLLPARLQSIAAREGFSYKSVTIRQLKGRWGSCDQNHHIVLNLYLMQLPWQLIDYVIVHELVHTKHLHHGTDFWAEFLRHEPSAKQLRKEIRTYQPTFFLAVA